MLGYLYLRQRDSPNLANFQKSRGSKTANAGVAVVDFEEHKNNLGKKKRFQVCDWHIKLDL